MPRFLSSFFLYSIIFITGLAGLVYQVSWQKYLSRLLGSDSIATAIILAAFLGGLSAGYYLCGKLTTRVKNHLRAYALLEGIIGVWCLNFPMIFKGVESFTQYWSFSPPLLIILQGFFCSVLLMGIPTLCMGGTIPFLTRGISKNITEATRVHANVYAINTAGAFLGTLLAGFFLIPEFGLPLTVMGTAFLNLGACAYFYILSKSVSASSGPETKIGETEIGEAESAPRFSPPMLYAIAFLSGFYVMTLENVLIRISNFSLGSSSYSFSLIVAVFILSIAIGSHVMGRLKNIPGHLLFTNQLLITLSLVLVYLSLDTWPYWAHLIRITFQSNMPGMVGYYAYAFSALLIVLIVPVSLMGATVPIAFHEIKRNLKNVGRHSGILFSVNTLGNLSGSLIGGILFYYVLNNAGVFLAAAFFAAISTCLAGWRLPRGYFISSALLAVSLVIFLIFTPFYDETRFAMGTFRSPDPLPYSLKGPETFFRKFNKQRKLTFYEDGPMASVGVVENPSPPSFEGTPTSIIVNGKSDSSITGTDLYTIKLLAHLPALLAEQRNQAMVIGLGTGVTAGELTLYPDVETVDVAEISPSVIKALPLFGEFTHKVHENPKLSVHTGDAFRILVRSRKKWDIIISEPSNPWVAGVDLLFTQEFYKLANEHLTENGILVQWAHIYSATSDMLGMIANTMKGEFENVSAFMPNRWDLIFVASEKRFSVQDLDRAETVLQGNEAVSASLKVINIDSLEAILIREIWPSAYISDHFSRFGIQTMDNPRLHYMAGKSFFMRRSVPLRDLFSSPPAAYAHEFLMPLRYENWAGSSFPEATFDLLIRAMKNKEIGNLPMTKAVKLKACLADADFCELSEKETRVLDIISLIIGHPDHEENWEKLGLGDASFREKAGVLLNHVHKTRNWIVPYSTDGLKKLLKQGIIQGKDAYEKNWCAIQMAYLLLEERTDKSQVRSFLNQMTSRDAHSNIVLKDEDQKLLNALYQMMR